jgi:hypothetical protein
MSQRRYTLERIRQRATDLREDLFQIDSISKEDFELRTGAEDLERLIGYLDKFAREADRQLKLAQKTGNPADVNLDRWVSAIADVYERYSRKADEAKIWGSEANPGPFFSFLEACRPDEFVRFGELHPSRVRSILKRRKKHQPQRQQSNITIVAG